MREVPGPSTPCALDRLRRTGSPHSRGRRLNVGLPSRPWQSTSRPSSSARSASSGATSSRDCSSRATGPSSACRAGAPMPRRATATSLSICSTPRTRRKSLPDLKDATHIFYAAFQPAPGAAAGYASNIAPNRDMLVNAVTAIDRASSALRRVVLVTGTKYYGSHLGPYKTPARESDPRHVGAQLLFRPDRLAHRVPARQTAGTGWSCGRRLCAALRRARR